MFVGELRRYVTLVSVVCLTWSVLLFVLVYFCATSFFYVILQRTAFFILRTHTHIPLCLCMFMFVLFVHICFYVLECVRVCVWVSLSVRVGKYVYTLTWLLRTYANHLRLYVPECVRCCQGGEWGHECVSRCMKMMGGHEVAGYVIYTHLSCRFWSYSDGLKIFIFIYNYWQIHKCTLCIFIHLVGMISLLNCICVSLWSILLGVKMMMLDFFMIHERYMCLPCVYIWNV